MKRKLVLKIIGILGLSFVSSSPAFGSHVQPEIFVSGQQYSSVEDYKLERVRKMIRSIYPSAENDDFSLKLGQILGKHSVEELNRMSDEELRSIVLEVEGRHLQSPNVVVSADGDLKDMNQMLTDLQKKDERLSSIKIDPKKIKTIEIKAKQ